MLKRLFFNSRLVGANLLIILLLIAAILFSFVQVDQLSETGRKLDLLNRAHALSNGMKAGTAQEGLQLLQTVYQDQSYTLSDYLKNPNRPFTLAFQQYRQINLNNRENEGFIKDVAERADHLDQIQKKINQQLSNGKSDAAFSLIDEEYFPAENALLNLLDLKDQWFVTEIAKESASSASTTNSVKQVLLIGDGAVVLIALLASVIMVFSFGRSIQQLRRTVKAFSDGDLSARVETSRKNELGDVAVVFNEMAERLSGLLGDIEQKRRVGLSTSYTVNSVASQLADTATSQAEVASNQAASLQQIMTSLLDMKETTHRIAERAGQVATSAENTLQNATELRDLATATMEYGRTGQEQVQQSLLSSYNVQEQISDFETALKELKGNSKQIGAIVSLIKEVADQTHLLSLNAAIEAAGAGEHGERFQVVAAEIKNLADTALKATGEVEQVITRVLGAIEETGEEMQKTMDRVESSVQRSIRVRLVIAELGEKIDAMDARFDTVVNLMQQVNAEVEQIKGMTGQQEATMHQVNQNLQLINTTTQDAVGTSQQLSSSAMQLESLSRTLTGSLAG